MPDREKVIGHLNDCLESSRRDNTWVFVRKDIVEDAIALLKKQEISNVYKCPNCGTLVSAENVVRGQDCRWYDSYGFLLKM